MENEVFVVRDKVSWAVVGFKVFKNRDSAEVFAEELNTIWKVEDYYVDNFEWVE